MRLFLQLCRESGLTWVAVPNAAIADYTKPHGAALPKGGAAPRPPPVKPDHAMLLALCREVAKCTAIISWGVAPKVEAIARSCRSAGVPAGDVAALEGATQIEMGVLFPADTEPPPADARLLAFQYFRIDAAGLLPAGAAPSNEQWDIMYAYERGLNIVCRAVAGAGKTTTLALCALRRPGASCVLLTYNKRLQIEVAKRVKKGITAFTYHSAAGRSYGCIVQNDEIFRKCVLSAPETPLKSSVFMIDEAQDMTIEYFALVRHLLRANPGAQVIVVGDELQAINEYKGARPEFLTEAAHLYSALTPGGWAPLRLSVSHRLTPSTAAFINNHLYGSRVIAGGNVRDPDLLPVYVAGRTKDAVTEALAVAVKSAVEKYKPEGVFVLAPSVRNLTTSQSPIADLVRRHLAGIPSFVAGQDDANVDADLIRGKLAVLSFNAVKGCERPCVIVVGLDETYFDYFDREWAEPTAVPNVLTVAATRASAQLVVITNSYRTLRTVAYDRLAVDATIRSVKAYPTRPKIRNRPPQKERALSVTDLVRHLHPETVRAAFERITVRPVVAGGPGGSAIALKQMPAGHAAPSKVRFGDYFEDLGFVYGIVAPVLAELARTGTTAFAAGLEAPTIVTTSDEVRPFSADITTDEYAAYPEMFWENVTEAALTAPSERSLAEWGRLAVARHAMEGGHHHVARQVTDYGWVSSESLNDARDTILRALDKIEGSFEVRLPSIAFGPNLIVGRADFVEKGAGIIWEFKNAGEYREEHALQLACYLALSGGGDGVLLSVLRREAWHVSVDTDDAYALLSLLAARIRDPVLDIFTLIERFDQGIMPEGSAVPEEPTTRLDLDDVY